MKKLVELSGEEAKEHFLKGSSYFNGDLPSYISFEPILANVAEVLNGGHYPAFKSADPSSLPGVNYDFLANKDGKLAWRPLELIHPVIYVSLANVLCDPANWEHIQRRLSEFEGGAVDCCSAPVMSLSNQKDVAMQIRSWWQSVEQRSLVYSLEYSHILHTDVTDCYGSLYTHSIPWAIHGLEEAKEHKREGSLLGNKIDSHIQASRYVHNPGHGDHLFRFMPSTCSGSCRPPVPTGCRPLFRPHRNRWTASFGFSGRHGRNPKASWIK